MMVIAIATAIVLLAITIYNEEWGEAADEGVPVADVEAHQQDVIHPPAQDALVDQGLVDVPDQGDDQLEGGHEDQTRQCEYVRTLQRSEILCLMIDALVIYGIFFGILLSFAIYCYIYFKWIQE